MAIFCAAFLEQSSMINITCSNVQRNSQSENEIYLTEKIYWGRKNWTTLSHAQTQTHPLTHPKSGCVELHWIFMLNAFTYTFPIKTCFGYVPLSSMSSHLDSRNCHYESPAQQRDKKICLRHHNYFNESLSDASLKNKLELLFHFLLLYISKGGCIRKKDFWMRRWKNGRFEKRRTVAYIDLIFQVDVTTKGQKSSSILGFVCISMQYFIFFFFN